MQTQPYTYAGPYQSNTPHGHGTLQTADFHFTGNLQHGMKSGHGILRSEKSKFEGNFVKNQPFGEGKLTTETAEIRAFFDDKFNAKNASVFLKSGEKFIGEVENQFEFRIGKMQLQEEFYDGEFVNNVFGGYGKLIGVDFVYEGEFQNGLQHGCGKLQKGDQLYVGSFKNDQKCGFGVLKTPEMEFRGEFQSNLMKNGKIAYKDGSQYTGEFQDGIRSGNGVIVTKEGMVLSGEFAGDEIKFGEVKGVGYVYLGELRDFTFNGKGVYTNAKGEFSGEFCNGQIVQGEFKGQNVVYKGSFRNFEFNGRGELSTSAGVLRGGFLNNYAEGICDFKSYDQRVIYYGGYRQGKKNGQGFYEKPGLSYTGEWRNDLQHGFGVEKKSGEEVFQGEFCKGDRVFGVGKKEIIDISPERIYTTQSYGQESQSGGKQAPACMDRAFRRTSRTSSSTVVQDLTINTGNNSMFSTFSEKNASYGGLSLSKTPRFRSTKSNLQLTQTVSVCPGVDSLKVTKRWRK